MSRIYDATGKFAFDLFDINVMMSRFCLTRIFVDPKVWENTCSVSSLWLLSLEVKEIFSRSFQILYLWDRQWDYIMSPFMSAEIKSKSTGFKHKGRGGWRWGLDSLQALNEKKKVELYRHLADNKVWITILKTAVCLLSWLYGAITSLSARCR